MKEIDKQKYERAKKQVENEKGWYSHLIAYIIINTCLQLFYAGFFDDGSITGNMPWWVRLTTPTIWGISLFLHWLYVFKAVRLNTSYKKWEDRKIKEFMEAEEEGFMGNIRKEKKQIPSSEGMKGNSKTDSLLRGNERKLKNRFPPSRE